MSDCECYDSKEIGPHPYDLSLVPKCDEYDGRTDILSTQHKLDCICVPKCEECNVGMAILPVPPVQMRPSTIGDFGGGSSMEDDLTRKLADIVKAHLRIKNKENQNENYPVKNEMNEINDMNNTNDMNDMNEYGEEGEYAAEEDEGDGEGEEGSAHGGDSVCPRAL